MEGVLVKRSKLSACLNIGLSKFLGLYNPLNIEQKLFDFLNLLIPRNPESPEVINNGKVLPQIMCDWLTGDKTTEEIRAIVELGLEKHDSFFTTNSQKGLIAAMAEFMFTPERLIKAIYPVKDAVKLVKKCHGKTDKNGHKNRIFILTNWDAESFPLLYRTKALRHLFQRADGIVVSGSVHLLKPDPTIFAYLCDTFTIDPEKELTVFVDDTLANLQPAKEFGIHTIHCQNTNIHAVKREFKNLGVL
jgi:FMN phosphatase YigB (HAD superfamily)